MPSVTPTPAQAVALEPDGKASKPAAMNAKDACRYLGCGMTTLYTLKKMNLIRSVVHKTNRHNVSGRRVFLTDSMDAYLESLEKP